MGMIIPCLTGKLIIRILWDLVHIVKSYNDYYCSFSPPTLIPGRPFRCIFISVMKLYSLHHLPLLYFHSFLQRETKSIHKGIWKSCAGANSITRRDSSFPLSRWNYPRQQMCGKWAALPLSPLSGTVKAGVNFPADPYCSESRATLPQAAIISCWIWYSSWNLLTSYLIYISNKNRICMPKAEPWTFFLFST